MTRRLAVLRPEPGASLTAARATDAGFDDVVTVPLFKVRPTDWTAPDPERFDAILMTSANAARHGGEELRKLRALPVHAVGEATASAARAAGLMVDEVGEGGIDDLLARLPDGVRLLHLAGRHRRFPEDTSQTIVPVTVYTSIARESPRGFDFVEGAIALVHSPRAGARLFELADRDGLDRGRIAVAAISEEAGAACGDGWERRVVAGAPNDRDLLRAAKTLLVPNS